MLGNPDRLILLQFWRPIDWRQKFWISTFWECNGWRVTLLLCSTFYEFDQQGNVAERLNSGGSATDTSTADAFGKVTNSSAVSDPSGYVGKAGYYTDLSTGLVLTTFRYYDPGAGRFLNRDPFDYGGGLNLYEYAQNNPQVYVDPTGLEPRLGETGGQVINCSSYPIEVVFDIYYPSTGTRYEIKSWVPPGMETNPDLVDIDFVLGGEIPFMPWRHIPGYHNGLGTCRLFNLPGDHYGEFGPGLPMWDDGTGWPAGYGNDRKLHWPSTTMAGLGYLSFANCGK